ncbi:hypothetical protein ACFY1J_27215 [Streptomyces sp. NPDC001406]|uniref:hypothetical protein n=1 Tax=Streptomyces sp. NPDC001406 TaxID=3364572 RepID=UPI00368E4B95
MERTAHGLLPHRLPAGARAQFPDERNTLTSTCAPGPPRPGPARRDPASRTSAPSPTDGCGCAPRASGKLTLGVVRRIGERFAGLALTADGPFAERGRADRCTRSAR